MAQLGALAMWKNYKENKAATIQNYKNALQLGYTKSIGEIYSAAGVQFNFSRQNIHELAQFVLKEIENLNES
jgi:oligoendopeptidase F